MLKKNDWFLLGAVLLVAGGLYAGFRLWPTAAPTRVVATVDNAVVFTMPLTQPGRYEIPQTDGASNVVEITADGVRMVEANCPDGWCKQKGKLTVTRDAIVCLPHHLSVELKPAELQGESESDSNSDLDVVIQ